MLSWLTVAVWRPYSHKLAKTIVAPWCHDKCRTVLLRATHWRLYALCANVRWLGHDKNFKERGRERQRKQGRERKEREGYCLLPTSSLLFASFFWEWHQQPTQGASLFFYPSLFASLQAFTGLSVLCQISLMMELFVLLDVPSRTPHYS